MIDTATAKQLLQSKDIAEIQAVVTEYEDHEDPDASTQYQIIKLLLLLQNRILQLQTASQASNLEQSDTFRGMAQCWMQMGDMEKCQGQLNKSLALDCQNVDALLLQGEVYSAQARYDQSIEQTEKAIALLQQQQQANDVSNSLSRLELALAYSKLASTFEMVGDFEQAVAILKKSITECIDTQKPDSNIQASVDEQMNRTMITATLQGHLGTIQEKMGRYGDAIQALTLSVEAHRLGFGKEHSKTLEMEYLLEMATSTNMGSISAS